MKKGADTDKLINTIVRASEAKKASNLLVLDIERAGKFADFMVIVSGDSAPQLKAIMKEIDLRVKKLGIKGTVWEGSSESGWMIFDLGSILVHVMSEEERAYYKLEELWGKEAVVYH